MLTVDKATLTVKSDPNQRTYGDTEDPEFTIRYFGFFNDDAEEGATIEVATTTVGDVYAVIL